MAPRAGDGNLATASSPEETRRTGQTSPWRVLAATAAAGLVIAVAFTRIPSGGTTGEQPSSSPAPRPLFVQGHGSLIYTTVVGPGHTRAVTRFNLASGTTTLGPRVPDPVDLVDASRVGSGWLGLTAGPEGKTVAYLLHGTSPSFEPARIGTGDLVAWGPGSTSVAFATTGAERHGCRDLRIDVANLLTNVTEPVLEEPRVCADVLSLGRSGSATYFTEARPSRLGVYFTGVVGVPHLLLDGYAMLSVSPASDFLVVPEGGAPAEGSPSGTSAQSGGAVLFGRGAVLFWRGHGGPIPIKTADFVLVVDRVLAWSPDGAQVAVEGRMGFREGVFVIDAGPGLEPRAPTFVVPGGDGLDATFDDSGTLYIVINGHLFSYADGVLADLLLPPGSPAANGPIVWTP